MLQVSENAGNRTIHVKTSEEIVPCFCIRNAFAAAVNSSAAFSSIEIVSLSFA
jgi:hypothetical protein